MIARVDSFPAGEPDLDKASRRFSVEQVGQWLRQFATLSEALRILGAAVLVASMSVFLLQGWSEGNDVSRYLLLLAQTALLTAAGFAMSHGLRETRGARIFFGLALVSVPANFTILGALLYSVLQWDGGLTSYPDFAHWRIDDIAGVGITFAGAMIVLVPVALFCYAIMARRSAKPLTLSFLLLNSLLLLPIRSSVAAGAIGLLGVAYALFVVGRRSGKDHSLTTGEGRFALATLFIPGGIVLFRSLYFYEADSLLIAMVGMAVFLAARQASLFPDRSPKIAAAFETLSVPVALTVSLALADAMTAPLPAATAGAVVAAAYAALALDILRRTGHPLLTRCLSPSIAIVTTLSLTFSVMVNTSALSAILSLVGGGTLLLSGLLLKHRVAVLAGCVTLIAGLVFGLQDFLRLVLDSSWIDLAVFGACAIALGSVIDRYGMPMRLRLGEWIDTAAKRKQFNG